jgi:hypothetical protein
MDRTLSAAIVSSKKIIELSHPLAAANHHQWAVWESWVLRNPEDLTPDMADTIIGRALDTGIKHVFETHAKTVIGIVQQAVGTFAYSPDLQRIVQRKVEQFTDWVNYAVNQEAKKRDRWLAQCKMPFLALPAQMQQSDYDEAKKDLLVVAEAGGLILADPLPELAPQSEARLSYVYSLHRLHHHGSYVCSEQPFTNLCVGCGYSWSTSY